MTPLTNTDYYKLSHERFMNSKTTEIYSNLTARSGRHAPVLPSWDNKVVFFYLQGWIKEYLIKEWDSEFFNKPKEEVISKFKRRVETSLGPDSVSMDHFEELHDLGFLPIEIRALPEGSRVPIGVPMLTIHNTHPHFAWLTNYLETVMSCDLWKPITTATIAYEYRKLMEKYSDKTCDNRDHIQFQCHDFSFRGMAGRHDAARSGSSHLLSFSGTDTIPAIDYLEEYYEANADEELIGVSVPASEHSVTSLGTAVLNEYDTIDKWISEDYPSGIVSVVSDTYDYWKVLTEFLPKLKDKVMARDGKVVIRPDSGDPADIICGEPCETYDTIDELKWAADDHHYDLAKEACEGSYCYGEQTYSMWGVVDGKRYCAITSIEYNRHDKEYYYPDELDTEVVEMETKPEQKGSIELLWETFGGTINDKGYKVLDPHIGLIYGDSITLERADDILSRLEAKGFAASNVVFGVGSFTYQYLTRDTFGMAVKATAAIVDGKPLELFKDPVTDDGTKKSAKGYLQVYKGDPQVDDSYYLIDQCENISSGELRLVFANSILIKETTLREIRERLNDN